MNSDTTPPADLNQTPVVTITDVDDANPLLFKTDKIFKKRDFSEMLKMLTEQNKQIKELQIAVFTLNKVLHVFRDKGLDALDARTMELEKRLDEQADVQNNHVIKTDERLDILTERLDRMDKQGNVRHPKPPEGETPNRVPKQTNE